MSSTGKLSAIRASRLLLAAITMLIGITPIWAAVYKTIDFPGAIYTSVNGGPSPKGDVVGTYIDSGGKVHGFIGGNKGTFTTIDYPGATNTQVNGWVNPRGDVVGQYRDTANKTHGFLLDKDGNFSTVDYPGSTSTVLAGINPQGQMIGTFCTTIHCGAFTVDNGVFTELTTAGATITSGATISPSGATVSACSVSGKGKICLIDNGNLTLVDFPGSPFGSSPGAGNPENDVVGGFTGKDNVVHGLLWSNGVYTQLDVPGAIYTYATGISPEKYVVGQYLDTAGKSHGFIVRP